MLSQSERVTARGSSVLESYHGISDLRGNGGGRHLAFDDEVMENALAWFELSEDKRRTFVLSALSRHTRLSKVRALPGGVVKGCLNPMLLFGDAGFRYQCP